MEGQDECKGAENTEASFERRNCGKEVRERWRIKGNLASVMAFHRAQGQDVMVKESKSSLNSKPSYNLHVGRRSVNIF